VGPWVKIDLKELFTITALAVGRQAEQTEWTDFRVSYAMVVEQWKFHGDITKSLLIGRGDGQERVTVNLNPPIGQARYVKLDLAGSAISLKLELFGCKVPPSRGYFSGFHGLVFWKIRLFLSQDRAVSLE
jgi:hypothetical protein